MSVFPNNTSKLTTLFKSLYLSCCASSRKAVYTSFNNVALTNYTGVPQSTWPLDVHEQVAISCLHSVPAAIYD